MTSESTAPAKPRRRWLQFSLRTLLLVMIPIACLAAWLGAELRRCQQQQAALEWVDKNDGVILYDTGASARDWRRHIFGAATPPHAETIYFRFYEVHAEYADGGFDYFNQPNSLDDLSPLAELTSLKALGLCETCVSDLAPLAALDNLRELHLVAAWRVRDLTPLAQLHRLEKLDLRGTQARDLSPLAGLTSLRELKIVHPSGPYTEAEVQALQQALPECTIIFSEYVPMLWDGYMHRDDGAGNE